LYKIQPKTVFIGKSYKYLPSCHSTNETAIEILENQSVEEGFVVCTSDQTKGKGQRGNIWESESGKNITMTLILKPTFLKAIDQFKLNMAVSIGIYNGICNFLENQTSLQLNENLKIKWPNDIYIGNSKIGGILIENNILGSNINTTIIGIGLNVNQLSFSNANASSLKSKLGCMEDFSLELLMETIFEHIEQIYLELKTMEFSELQSKYHSLLFRKDEWHPFLRNGILFNGKIVGVDQYGKLILDTIDGEQGFDFKEISFVL
jgi:BirA family transcriptional regulator, biotin operon repressor / biotin---[acetyl-CoA-carboxylase] ligase